MSYVDLGALQGALVRPKHWEDPDWVYEHWWGWPWEAYTSPARVIGGYVTELRGQIQSSAAVLIVEGGAMEGEGPLKRWQGNRQIGEVLATSVEVFMYPTPPVFATPA